jgi:hypothetical protein
MIEISEIKSQRRSAAFVIAVFSLLVGPPACIDALSSV